MKCILKELLNTSKVLVFFSGTACSVRCVLPFLLFHWLIPSVTSRDGMGNRSEWYLLWSKAQKKNTRSTQCQGKSDCSAQEMPQPRVEEMNILWEQDMTRLITLLCTSHPRLYNVAHNGNYCCLWELRAGRIQYKEPLHSFLNINVHLSWGMAILILSLINVAVVFKPKKRNVLK